MPEMQQQKTKFISRGLSTCQGILGCCLVFFLKSRSTAASHAKVCSSSPRSTKAHTASTTAVKAVTDSEARIVHRQAATKQLYCYTSILLTFQNALVEKRKYYINGKESQRLSRRDPADPGLDFRERRGDERKPRSDAEDDVKNCKENCEVKYYRHRSFSSIKYLYFNKLKRRLIDTKLMAVKLLPLDASHPPFHSESSTGSISKPKQLSGAHCVALSCIRTSVSPKRRPKLDSAQCLKQSKVKKKVTGTFTVLSSADEDAKQLKHQALSASLGEIQLRQNSPKSICNRKPNSKIGKTRQPFPDIVSSEVSQVELIGIRHEDPARGRVTKRKRYRYWGPEPQLRKLVRLEPVQREKPLRGETGTERQGAAPSQRLEEAQMQPRRSSPAKI
ncbi:hypothetical protein MJT46_018774 [Ovis ammon polii x Ovis aries]|nr:hypothetical protein MJT46_018774 [Ovis ammon polii x Ovis aries]